MPGRGGDKGGKLIDALVGGAAAYVARKLIVFSWTKATGRQPPDKAEDREVAFGEAIVWAVMVGAGVAAARVVATRFAGQQAQRLLTGRVD